MVLAERLHDNFDELSHDLAGLFGVGILRIEENVRCFLVFLEPIRKRLAIGILQSGMLFFALSVFLSHRGLYDAFFIQEMSTYTGLVFFGMLFAPIDLVLSFFAQAFSRKNEFEADAFALETASSEPTGK